MTGQDLSVALLGLGVLLATTRALGEVAARARQPPLVGELLAGVLLGPTVFGRLAPAPWRAVFPASGAARGALDAVAVFAFVCWLLVAGLEVDLPMVGRRHRLAGAIALAGLVGPGLAGFLLALAAPDAFGGAQGGSPMVFAGFVAAALSISAFPLIARALMDVGIQRTEVGMVTVGAAMIDDVVGWVAFAALVGGAGAGTTAHGASAAALAAWTLGVAALALGPLRITLRAGLRWFRRTSPEPAGIMGLAVALVLLGGALTEWLGVGLAIGAFLAGIAVGNSGPVHAAVRPTLRQFVTFVLVPLFFGSIGLRIDFAAHFDWPVVLTVCLVATAGKTLGCHLGARLVGLGPWQAWTVGFAMNSRGGMEVLFGALGLQAGLIGERTFVALVVMALVTSMMAGPAMAWCWRAGVAPRPGSDVQALRGEVG